MVILAFVVQVPASRCGGEPVRILRSKTHACGFASIRDTHTGANNEGTSGSYREADVERDGETAL